MAGSQGLVCRLLPISESFDHTQDEILVPPRLRSTPDDVPSFLTKELWYFYVKIIAENEGTSQELHTLPCIAFKNGKGVLNAWQCKSPVENSQRPRPWGCHPLPI